MKRDDRSGLAALCEPASPGAPGVPVALTHLQRLEAESIHIMREVAAECEKPVMLYSDRQGQRLHAAPRQEGLLSVAAAVPAAPRRHHLEVQGDVRVARPDGRARRRWSCSSTRTRRRRGSASIRSPTARQLHTDMWKTQGLKQALDLHGFDAAFGGARRDEEKSRAKERIFSFRSAQHRWDPKSQRPELWRLYNARKHPGEIDPRLPAVELDRARHLAVHLPREHPGRAALSRGDAAGGRARRHPDHGRRRPHAAPPGRGADAEDGALSHPRLLSADRRRGVAPPTRCPP